MNQKEKLTVRTAQHNHAAWDRYPDKFDWLDRHVRIRDFPVKDMRVYKVTYNADSNQPVLHCVGYRCNNEVLCCTLPSAVTLIEPF